MSKTYAIVIGLLALTSILATPAGASEPDEDEGQGASWPTGGIPPCFRVDPNHMPPVYEVPC